WHGPRAFRRDGEIGTEERGANLGDELLHGIAGTAVPLAAEIAIEAGFVAGALGGFFGGGGGEGLRGRGGVGVPLSPRGGGGGYNMRGCHRAGWSPWCWRKSSRRHQCD